MAAILLDVDGVLHVSGDPIPGAAEAVRRLRADGHRLRFVTNTTVRSKAQLASALRGHGIEVDDSEVQTTADAAVRALRGKRVLALTMHALVLDLEEIELVGEGADAVLIGGADETPETGLVFSYMNLAHAFAELELAPAAVQQALFLIGPVYIGVNLPLSAQGATSWDVPAGGPTGNGAPGSWGGHCVPIVAYDASGVTVITWGAKLLATWAFLAAYMDEDYVPVSQDFVDAQGEDPAGLSLAQMVADATALGQPSAAPAPPAPAPSPPSWWQRLRRRFGWR